jgi:hypothetical protein
MSGVNSMKEKPIHAQNIVFKSLTETLHKTKFGKEHEIDTPSFLISENVFRTHIPIRTYDEIKPWILRAREGEIDVLWPGQVSWFAKTSGTTSDRSKILPVTKESLKSNHYKGGRDLLAMFCDEKSTADLYTGKHLIIGGSSALHPYISGSYTGDLSAIIIKNLPFWVETRRTPGREITMLENWEEKVELMAEEVIGQDVRILAGIPSWMLVVIRRVLEKSGKKSLIEVWPNLQLYMHGGVGFEPYKDEFRKLINSDKLSYMETYNASEGFFAIQDSLDRDDMLLLLNHGIYYEFLSYNEIDSEVSDALSLGDVELGGEYALVISTNAGLWRYLIGDIVKITCVSPYRIKVVGRVSSYINIAGEELMVNQAESAVSKALLDFNLSLKEFTAAPRFSNEGIPVGHSWAIEVSGNTMISDVSIEGVSNALDLELKKSNSDYSVKRESDFILGKPEVIFVKEGSFEVWLKNKNKLGGQHKIPRLSNSRDILEEVLRVIPNR